MKNIIHWLLHPPVTGHSNILIIRWMTGTVFFWEGLRLLLLPETTAHFVAISEMIGGLLLVFGLLTRITALYFIIQMIVAILNTLPKTGAWTILHEFRLEYPQLLTCLFLLLEGPGRRSIDFSVSTAGKVYRMN